MRPLLSILLCVWIIFTSGVSQSVCSTQQSTKWRRMSALDNKTVDRSVYSSSLGQSVLLSTDRKVECGNACRQRAWCRSFFYVASSGACYVHEDIFDSSVQTNSLPGAVYFQYQDDFYCPRWKGYTTEPHSGLCYKIMYNRTIHVTARTLCAAEGASMVTLDTDIKVQGMMDVLINITALYNRWIHMGGSRPAAEWGTTFTANSNFLQWEKTGQSLDKVKWFTPPEPTYSSAENCMFVGVFPSYYTNFTTFTTFYNYQCTWSSEFICEMYHG